MTILSLSNRLIEGYVSMPSILGERVKIEINRGKDIQGTLDSIEELMDLKGSLFCDIKIIHTSNFTRYGFVQGDMTSVEFREAVTKVCKEFC